MQLDFLPWIILFLPLAAAGVILLGARANARLSAGLSTGAVIIACLLSIIFIAVTHWQPAPEVSVPWLSIGGLHADFTLRLDSLSLMMLLIVTGIASLVHIYSWGYLAGDPGFARYFGCLSFFTFTMLGIVLAGNFLQMFVFWELVGVASYLLIGFWFEKPSAADAAKKAFITNRLGDLGFIIGILMVWAAGHSLNFIELENAFKASPMLLGGLTTLAGVLIFCGAVGKSAQFPLHVWLPDAMEGPTPVSALIHAATMVAAGVYMLCRVFFIISLPGSHALEVIAWIGGFTALLAALIAVQQDDIKRILAYSTLSQLGYMVMAVGLAGPYAGMFHLTTHAFFKALLFLGAGSVIVAMHHEQDIWKMGGLRKLVPVTFWTFLVGSLALSALPPLSGFYSKDSILALALEQHQYALFAIGLGVAGLTAFYVFRLVFVVFFGAHRSDSARHAHESPPVMLWPLRILAVLSVIGGAIGLEYFYETALGHAEGSAPSIAAQLIHPFVTTPLVSLGGIGVAAVGIWIAYATYFRAAADPLPARLGVVSRLMRNRFYFDEIYEATFIRLHDCLACAANFFERWIISGFVVRGIHGTTELTGLLLRVMQTGNLQTYAFLFALGIAAVLLLLLK